MLGRALEFSLLEQEHIVMEYSGRPGDYHLSALTLDFSSIFSYSSYLELLDTGRSKTSFSYQARQDPYPGQEEAHSFCFFLDSNNG